MTESPYGWPYRRARARLLAQGLRCALRLVCDGVVADSADHDPPLALHRHQPGTGCCVLRPACLSCQKVQGRLVARHLRHGDAWPPRGTTGPPAPSRPW